MEVEELMVQIEAAKRKLENKYGIIATTLITNPDQGNDLIFKLNPKIIQFSGMNLYEVLGLAMYIIPCEGWLVE
jgi:hypothetical protein